MSMLTTCRWFDGRAQETAEPHVSIWADAPGGRDQGDARTAGATA